MSSSSEPGTKGQDSLSETNAKQENQADLHENPGLVGFAGPE
jgi:hypothetical protein